MKIQRLPANGCRGTLVWDGSGAWSLRMSVRRNHQLKRINPQEVLESKQSLLKRLHDAGVEVTGVVFTEEECLITLAPGGEKLPSQAVSLQRVLARHYRNYHEFRIDWGWYIK